MDTFLTKLFRDDLEKQAASQTQELMGTLDIPELEEYLGLSKQAVAGPDHAPYPIANKGSDEARREWINVGIAQRHGDQPRQYKEQTEKKAGLPRALSNMVGKGLGGLSAGLTPGMHPAVRDRVRMAVQGGNRARQVAASPSAVHGVPSPASSLRAPGTVGAQQDTWGVSRGTMGPQSPMLGGVTQPLAVGPNIQPTVSPIKTAQAQLIQTAFHSTRESPEYLQKIAMDMVAAELVKESGFFSNLFAIKPRVEALKSLVPNAALRAGQLAHGVGKAVGSKTVEQFGQGLKGGAMGLPTKNPSFAHSLGGKARAMGAEGNEYMATKMQDLANSDPAVKFLKNRLPGLDHAQGLAREEFARRAKELRRVG